MKERFSKTALVLAGGGSRGAYEAGVLHYIRTMLPPKVVRSLPFHILCGSSVGAINTAFLASTAENPILQGQKIVDLWKNLHTGNVYRSGPITLGRLVARTSASLGSHLLGIKGVRKADDVDLHFQSLFDTSPFLRYLRKVVPWRQIPKNIESGLVHALAISATNMISGQLEFFLQRNPHLSKVGRHITRNVRISPRHAAASAAIPILFPPVLVHGTYYNDGGLRLTTPLGPAVSMGAENILVIGTRYTPPKEEENPIEKRPRHHRPSLGEILGKFLNAVLLDRLEADTQQFLRINGILDVTEKHVSQKDFRKICEEARVEKITSLRIFPSEDIAQLVDETVMGSYRKVRSFGVLERFILKLLDSSPDQGSALLSYFLFEPSYLGKLIDLGFEDARRRHDDLVEFCEHSAEKSARA